MYPRILVPLILLIICSSLGLGNEIANLTNWLTHNIQTIEQKSEMFCEIKFVSFSLSRLDGLDWNSFAVQNTPYEVEVNTSTKSKPSPASRHFSICLNILIFLPSNTKELSSFSNKISKFGRPSHDRYFLLSPRKAILEKLIRSEAEDFQRLKMKAGIYFDTSTSSPMFLTESKIYTSDILTIEQFEPPILSRFIGNLNGRNLKLTTFNLPPYFIIEDGKLGGVHYNVLNSICAARNCTLDIDLSKTKGTTGVPLANGTWTGMMGDVITGDADIAAMMGINELRYSAVDFTTFTLQDGMVFVTAHPKFVVKWQSLFYPFTVGLWGFVIGTFVIFLPLFYLSLNISEGTCKKKSGGTGLRTAYKAFMISYSLSLDQAVPLLDDSKKKLYTTKSIAILWLTFTMITGIAYKSNLIGSLSFPKPDEIPRTFGDLHSHKDYKLNFNYLGGAGILLFKSSTSEMYKSITKRLVLERNVEACITSAIIEKKSVCIQWYLVLHSAMAKYLTVNLFKEPMFISRDPAGFIFVGIGLKKNSIYTESIGKFSSGLRDTGHVQKWIDEVLMSDKIKGKARFFAQNTTSTYKIIKEITDAILEEKTVKPMNMKKLSSVFFIYVLGFIGAATAFQFEMKLCELFSKLKIIKIRETGLKPFNW